LDTNMESLFQKDKKYIIHGWGYNPVVIVKGKGAIVWDVEGREYIDCISQCAGPVGIGHSHPKVIEAVIKQLQEISHVFMGYVIPKRVELAEKLEKILPQGFNKFYFTSGGSEAVETALKGAMRITKKKEIISLYLAYHGGTIACLNLGQPWHRDWLPIVPGFRQIPPPYCYRCFYGKEYPGCDFECARALEYMIKYGSHNDVAAFILEPLMGNGGHIYPPSQEYAKIIMETCQKHDVLIIADEIQTGFGRTGKMWGFEYIGLKPDIVCFGKPLGGGLPIEAAIFNEEIVPEGFGEEVWHAFTFSGSPVMCAAACAAIDVVLEEGLPSRAAQMGGYITEKLKRLQDEHELIGDVRGPGLFIGVELVRNKRTKEKATKEAITVIQESLKRGVMFGLSNMPGIGNVIKIKPPLIISRELADKALNVFSDALKLLPSS